MSGKPIYGYAGKVLRVDLSRKRSEEIPLSADFVEKYIGGSSLGAKFLYDEVPPSTPWDGPENRVIIATGPLGGTRVSGSGLVSIVSKGPMTEHAGTSQTSGFFGAYLKFAGFDGIIVQGRSEKPCYLILRDRAVEIMDASHLWGLDTWDTEDRIRKDGNYGSKVSILTIGPSGENRVRFAIVAGDYGHVASKNGMGAVLGAKNLKAIVAIPGQERFPIYDEDRSKELARGLLKKARSWMGGLIHREGTAGRVEGLLSEGILPVRNYTTNLFPEYENLTGKRLREVLELKPKPCWACGLRHMHYVKVVNGPYAGTKGEEPEYECIAAFGPIIGQSDLGAVVMLSDLVDRLGLDVNEVGWLMGWIMECYDRGLMTKKDLDGLDMRWGNVEATRAMIYKIARREGIGDVLAEGVMRAAEKLGGEARECAVYTRKGATPRGHDHRGRWCEMIDTCFSTTSTLEATAMGQPRPQLFGFAAVKDTFDVEEVVRGNVVVSGYRVFEDSLGVCHFNTVDPELTVECVNAITGWNLDLPRAIRIGRGTIHRLRMFNLRHHQDIRLEAPSARYGSTPVNGPRKGIGVLRHWNEIRLHYYKGMGWDLETGWPLPETLQQFGLDELLDDLPNRIRNR